MRITNLKRAIIIFLMIGIIAVVPGCVRWPDGSEGEPEETDYQLRITVKVAGQITPLDGKYYIILDTDGNSIDGPDYDMAYWEDDFYYVALDEWGFIFTKVEEGSTSMTLNSKSWSDDTLQVTIALSSLEDPDSIDINVVTTDSNDETYYDYLDDYFTIGTTLYQTAEGDTEGGPEEGGANFNITEVTAEIISY
jgi:hypothetical protein